MLGFLTSIYELNGFYMDISSDLKQRITGIPLFISEPKKSTNVAYCKGNIGALYKTL